MDIYIFGNGFISHELAIDAKSRGDSVSVIARTIKTGDQVLLDSGILVEYVDSPDDFFRLRKFSPSRPSYFILALGIASPQLFETGAIDEEANNLLKLFGRIAARVSEYPETRIGYVSSGGTVYGNSSKSNSELSMCEPVTKYGLFHLKVENLFASILGEQFIALRLANPYGQEQTNRHQQGLIAYAYKQISQQLPVQLYGNGEQIRDYIDIKDASKLINSALRLECLPRIINVGTGVGTSNFEVAELVAQALDQELPVTFAPNREFDINRNVLAMDLAKSLSLPEPKPLSLRNLSYLVSDQ